MEHPQETITRSLLEQILPSPRELEQDPRDGTLHFEARLGDGLLATGERHPGGALQVNIYEDRHPDPRAGAGQIWKLHQTGLTAGDLRELVQAHRAPAGATT